MRFNPYRGRSAQVAMALQRHGRWAKLTRWRPTSKQEAIQSERGILNLLRSKWEVEDVPVAPKPDHYVHVTKGGKEDGPALVLMPGYGAGTGFFYRNLDGLSRAFKVYAVDWLGTGLSGRPAFTAVDRATTEDFFLESLNAWRAKQGLGKFILVGHSLGGYLAATYALRHPEQVEHLVLVGPAGIPAKPEGWESRFLGDTWSLRTQLYKLATQAWMSGITPGSVIRALGPWGPGLVEKYVTGRFSMQGQPLDAVERNVFKDYFYHIAAARGSGEYALRHILAPGAWAHAPLEDRLSELKVPVTFIYGEHDWMNPAAGVAAANKLDQLRPRKVSSDHVVEVVPDSGHFVFLEQPQRFNAALFRTTEFYLQHGLATKLIQQEEQDRLRKLQMLREEAQQEADKTTQQQKQAARQQ
eukprot:GHRR01007260.1.p1 GENE.GHRR01007260.1~~GHRR01007260.1.p1  ORF type:complete len:413 (+),score=123.85 GHRR01007260.1:218-1456(+)